MDLFLKVVADVAWVGVPNSGKSNSLALLHNRAQPMVTNINFMIGLGGYLSMLSLFCTQQQISLHITDHILPKLRTMRNRSIAPAGSLRCDVPGLIVAAAKPVGLGCAFGTTWKDVTLSYVWFMPP